MNLQQIIARMAEIRADIEARSDQITAEELANYETEVNSLREQRTQLEAAAQTRQNLLASIADGTRGVVLDNPTNQRSTQQAQEDPYGTMEYRQAFMTYVRTGQMGDMLVQQRDNAVTTSTDIGAVVPTTILNEVIRKMEEHGQIFARVRKTAIPGGVQVPVMTLKPVATWIAEGTGSDRQKVQAQKNDAVVFSYFGLEVKVAQSLIATLVGLPTFENAISDIIAEAMVAKVEADIFNGNGTGKPLGLTVDTRVPNTNVVTLTAAQIVKWDEWKKKVFAVMPIAYKRKAAFYMAGGTWEGYIDGMVDTAGQPIGRVNYNITEGIPERFAGKEVIQVEEDVIKSFDAASAGDVIAVYANLNDYGFNSNLQLIMYRYKDEDTNQIIDKAILVADGKLLDPNGVIIVKKAA